MRHHKYAAWEDDIIKEGHAKRLNSRQISDKLPGRSPSSVRERAEKLGLSFSRDGRRTITEDDRRVRGATKRRKCLVGGHMFDARVNEEGRFLEYSCPPCRNVAAARDRGALV